VTLRPALISIGIAALLVGVLAQAGAGKVGSRQALAQTGPTMLDPRLGVRTAVAGLELPTSIAHLGPNDLLVLEKDSGKVKRVVNGVTATVLDLAVNNFSERGLLGIALHPDFPADPGVYLYWTCRSSTRLDDDPFRPEERTCSDTNMFGLPDSSEVLEVPLLGNRVDRFVWTGSTLVFDHRLATFLAFQNDGAPEPPGQDDAEQPARGNHDGGVVAFGPDRKLYVLVGDVGRRGALQNLACGPVRSCADGTMPDDQFGGPEPDDAHFTGVIVRLDDDGSTPRDNPFFSVGAAIGGEVGENVQQIFSYGLRNSFGMAFDPVSGALWNQENGEDAFDELNRVLPGENSGWIQIAGPVSRIAQYKQIETTSLHHEDFPNLQQFRWPPEFIADTPQEGLSRLFRLPASHYSDPEFSWKFVLAPAAIGFARGRGLGPQFQNDLFVGFSTTDTEGGPLFHFNLTGNRRKIATDDPRLEDRVADNTTFHEMTESENLLIGTDFGIVTDIEAGPNGNLFVVSLSDGVIYEVFNRVRTPQHAPRAVWTSGRMAYGQLTPRRKEGR
jgi:aldose sugar dehydrogenase